MADNAEIQNLIKQLFDKYGEENVKRIFHLVIDALPEWYFNTEPKQKTGLITDKSYNGDGWIVYPDALGNYVTGKSINRGQPNARLIVNALFFYDEASALKRAEWLNADATLRRFMADKPKGGYVPYVETNPNAGNKFDAAVFKIINISNYEGWVQKHWLYTTKEVAQNLIDMYKRELIIWNEIGRYWDDR